MRKSGKVRDPAGKTGAPTLESVEDPQELARVRRVFQLGSHEASKSQVEGDTVTTAVPETAAATTTAVVVPDTAVATTTPVVVPDTATATTTAVVVPETAASSGAIHSGPQTTPTTDRERADATSQVRRWILVEKRAAQLERQLAALKRTLQEMTTQMQQRSRKIQQQAAEISRLESCLIHEKQTRRINKVQMAEQMDAQRHRHQHDMAQQTQLHKETRVALEATLALAITASERAKCESDHQTCRLEMQLSELQVRVREAEETSADTKRRSIDAETTLVSTRQRALDAEISLAAERRRAIDAETALAAERRRAIDADTALAAERQRTVGIETSVTLELTRTVAPEVPAKETKKTPTVPTVLLPNSVSSTQVVGTCGVAPATKTTPDKQHEDSAATGPPVQFVPSGYWVWVPMFGWNSLAPWAPASIKWNPLAPWATASTTESIVNQQQRDKTCRYFAQGRCAYGTRCRWTHTGTHA